MTFLSNLDCFTLLNRFEKCDLADKALYKISSTDRNLRFFDRVFLAYSKLGYQSKYFTFFLRSCAKEAWVTGEIDTWFHKLVAAVKELE